MSFLMRFGKNLRTLYRAFTRLELMNRAAALSFFTVISIFPMALLLASSIGYFVPADRFLDAGIKFMDEFLPFHSDLIESNLRGLFRKHAGVSWFGLIGFFFTAQMLYLNLEKAINTVLHIEKKRHFLSRRLMFFAWFLGMIFVLFAPLVFEILATLARKGGWEFVPFAKLSLLSAKGGFALAGFFMFVLVMLLLPVRRVAVKKILLWGSAFAGTLQAGKALFKWGAVHNLGRYNLVYGSLTSIILGLLWIFYFYALFLIFVYGTGRREDRVNAEEKKIKA